MKIRYAVTDTTWRVTRGFDFAKSMDSVTIFDKCTGKEHEYKLTNMLVEYFGTLDERDRFEPTVSIFAKRVLKEGRLSEKRYRFERFNTPDELYAELLALAVEEDPREEL